MNTAEETKTLSPWTEAVPAGWRVTRLDAVADVLFSNVDKHTMDGEEPVRLCNYVDVYKNDRITSGIDFMEASAEEREIKKFQIRRGDVLATKDSEEADDIAISSLVAEDLPGVLCGYHLAMIRPRFPLVSGPFLAWLHASKFFRAQYEAKAVGVTRFGLSQYSFRAARIPLPPPSEQQRITAYLDASCAAIDAAVAAKRRQLETLDTLCKSTIHRAVTVGLNAAVSMRISGVEWFDNIPVHWDIDRLKDVVVPKKDAIKVGPLGSDLLLGDMSDEGIKVFNQRTVIDRDFESGIHFISPEKYAEMKAFTVYPGDLLITTRGTIGRCAIVPDTAPVGILHPCLMRVQTKRHRLLPEYLAVLIQDCGLVLRQLQIMSAATTIDVIYSDSLKRTYLLLPPVKEQQTILDFLTEKNMEFRTLFAQIESQIAILTAYRKSLIHECVTGQRRVTEAGVARVRRGESESMRPNR